MSIIHNIINDQAFISINNHSLAGDEAMDLKSLTVELLDKGIMNISLDLDAPEFIDSSGIGKLLFMNKKIEKLGGTFTISSINHILYDFLKSLAINEVIKINDPT